MFDRDALAELIEAGRVRQASSSDIADEILARLQSPAWAKAMSHPTRAAVLRLLRDNGAMSPATASKLLDGDATLGALSYHFRALKELQLIELCDTVQRRGALEHVYRLVPDET